MPNNGIYNGNVIGQNGHSARWFWRRGKLRSRRLWVRPPPRVPAFTRNGVESEDCRAVAIGQGGRLPQLLMEGV